MPGCVLRVRSKTTRALVKVSGLQPIVIHRKGHPRVPGATALSPSSGFNVDVSRADGRLEKQAIDAARFLRRHMSGLARLRRCKAFGGMTLDFAVYDRATVDRRWPSYRLPATLIELAGKQGIEIELSFYGIEPMPANIPLQPSSGV
jgi:hypothetical protein